MVLCERCRQEIAARLKGQDYLVLERLQDLGATMAARAVRRDEVLNGTMSVHDLRDSLLRLGVAGCVGEESGRGRAVVHWITEDGSRVLERFKAELMKGGAGTR